MRDLILSIALQLKPWAEDRQDAVQFRVYARPYTVCGSDLGILPDKDSTVVCLGDTPASLTDDSRHSLYKPPSSLGGQCLLEVQDLVIFAPRSLD